MEYLFSFGDSSPALSGGAGSVLDYVGVSLPTPKLQHPITFFRVIQKKVVFLQTK